MQFLKGVDAVLRSQAFKPGREWENEHLVKCLQDNMNKCI